MSNEMNNQAAQTMPERTYMTRDEALKIARACAYAKCHTHDYLPRTAQEAADWQPHEWVLDAIRWNAILQPVRVSEAGAPEGWVLVPARMELTPENMETLVFMLGGDPESKDADERWNGGTLWVGETIGDHGEKYYGLNVANVECYEEGSVPIVEFAALSQTAGVPDGGRYFASGPEGCFYTEDMHLAEKIVNRIDPDDDWTITDLRNPTGAAPAASGGDVSERPCVACGELVHAFRDQPNPLHMECEMPPAGAPQSSNPNPVTTGLSSESGTSVSERARELLAQAYESAGRFVDAGLVRQENRLRSDDPILRALEQALTQHWGEQLGDFQDKALAWDAVCDALGSVSPMWGRNGDTGLLAAVNTIHSLATTTPQPGAEALREYIASLRDEATLTNRYSLTQYEKGHASRAGKCADELESLLARGGK